MNTNTMRMIVIESDLDKVKKLKETYFVEDDFNQLDLGVLFQPTIYCGDEPGIHYADYQQKYEDGLILDEIETWIAKEESNICLFIDPCIQTKDLYDCLLSNSFPSATPKFELAKRIISNYQKQVPICLLLPSDSSKFFPLIQNEGLELPWIQLVSDNANNYQQDDNGKSIKEVLEQVITWEPPVKEKQLIKK